MFAIILASLASGCGKPESKWVQSLTFGQLSADVRCVEFTHDSERLITGGDDSLIRIWDVNSGHLEALLGAHSGPVLSVAMSPDDDLFASAGEDKTVRIWRLSESKEQRLLKYRGGDLGVWHVAYAADGRHIAAMGGGCAQIWSTDENSLETFLLGETNERDSAAAFSQDGSRIVTVGGGAVRLWKTETGVREREMALKGAWQSDEGACAQCAYSPDGKYVAICINRSLMIVDASIDDVRKEWVSDDKVIVGACWSKDSETVAVATLDGPAWAIPVSDRSQLRRLAFRDARDSLLSVEFSPDGKFIAGDGWWDCNIFDAERGERIQPRGAKGKRKYVNTHRYPFARFSKDGRYLVDTSNPLVLWKRSGR
ncbi:MAG: hypothetical protein JSS02_29115 [Planctomycetes bacterium]|nr:hypothetical protein [Planctomycetota bacterium]